MGTATKNIGRKIFQPTELTNNLVEGMSKLIGGSQNDFINNAILFRLTPVTPSLKKEAEQLFARLEVNKPVTEKELQAILARAIYSLKDNPISDAKPLEAVLSHFITSIPRCYRYDYIQIVDTLQDERLHRLNEILKTLDDDYNLGMREFGERCYTIFKFWENLQSYSEIYVQLSTIIECENIYKELTIYQVLAYLMSLDNAVRTSKLQPIRDPFETDITLSQKFVGLKFEVLAYLSDNAYCELSGDTEYSKIPDRIRDYYEKLLKIRDPKYEEVSLEDFNQLKQLKEDGTSIFKRLTKKSSNQL